MMPSAAITAVCGTGNTRSAQMRAMPRAHAQLSYFRSVSTASLASWGVGIVAQEASTSDRTPITIRMGLAPGLASPFEAAQLLRPSSDNRMKPPQITVPLDHEASLRQVLGDERRRYSQL